MCEITHTNFSEKKEWENEISRSSYNIKAVHLDEQPDDLYQFSNGEAPCVVAKTTKVLSLFLLTMSLIVLEVMHRNFLKI